MSTYSQTRLVGNLANDAEFRVWGKFLSDSFEAAGWTKTADTGQIDWTTVTKPVAINTAAGYEIRKSPTQSGYTDFYLKIEDGSGGNVAYASVWLTVGTGSNGAGTLTGTVSTRYQKASSASTGGVEDFVCGGNDWLAFVSGAFTAAESTTGLCLAVERLTDADGNYQTDGLAVQFYGSGAANCYSMTSSGAYTATADCVLGYMPPSYAGTAGTVFVAPAMPNAPTAQYPMRALCYVGISNTGTGQTHSFAMFPGKTQTWRGSNLGVGSSATSVLIPEDVCPVIRWE